jgi:hypothetical protein
VCLGGGADALLTSGEQAFVATLGRYACVVCVERVGGRAGPRCPSKRPECTLCTVVANQGMPRNQQQAMSGRG